MPETEGLARKRKVRAAHHGSVTRIVSQVYENLKSGEALNLPRLRQQKSPLSGKLDVLSKLDDELIEMVAEDELDNEVEQADIIKKIGLCIMDIDQALECASSHKVTDCTSAGGDSSHTTPSTKIFSSTRTHSEGTTPTSPSTETGDDTLGSPPPTDTALTPPPVAPGDGGTTPSPSITPHVKLPKLSINSMRI